MIYQRFVVKWVEDREVDVYAKDEIEAETLVKGMAGYCTRSYQYTVSKMEK